MIEQMRIDEQERRQALREGRAPPSDPQGSDEGYLAYMSRQVQERTERLGIVGDSMDRLEENSSNFASDVGKYIQSQKRKAVFGGKSFALVKIAPCVVRHMRLTDLFGSPWVQVWFLGFSLKQTGCYLYRDAVVRKVDTQLKTISVALGSFVYRWPQLPPLAMMNIHADGHGSKYIDLPHTPHHLAGDLHLRHPCLSYSRLNNARTYLYFTGKTYPASVMEVFQW